VVTVNKVPHSAEGGEKTIKILINQLRQ